MQADYSYGMSYLFFFRKLGKCCLSSAAVVIGALRVNEFPHARFYFDENLLRSRMMC